MSDSKPAESSLKRVERSVVEVERLWREEIVVVREESEERSE